VELNHWASSLSPYRFEEDPVPTTRQDHAHRIVSIWYLIIIIIIPHHHHHGNDNKNKIKY